MTSPTSGPSGRASAGPEAGSARAEAAALQEALAAEHVAVWGYGTVGAALAAGSREDVVAAQEAHRQLRDQVAGLLLARDQEPVAALAGYALPFPVLSEVDAAVLAVQLEQGSTTAWVWVLDQAAERSTRELAVGAAAASEVRAVGWRTRAGQTPVTTATPGLPD